MALGLSPVITLGTDLIVGAAPPERAGSASAISETGAELGGALGIAILGSIANSAYRAQIDLSGLGLGASSRAHAEESVGGAIVFGLLVGDTQPLYGAYPGIYGLIGKAAGQMGNAIWLAFLVSMVAALLTGLSYASIASRYPKAAGAAYVTQRAYRQAMLTYVVGLAVMCSGLTSVATQSRVVAENLTSARKLRDFVRGYEEAGCDELVLFPAVAELDELERLAEALR